MKELGWSGKVSHLESIACNRIAKIAEPEVTPFANPIEQFRDDLIMRAASTVLRGTKPASKSASQ